MERDVACELWRSAPEAGVKFSTYVGDDDSTTLADIHAKVPYDVQKWSDIVHTKRSLTSRLYNLQVKPILTVLAPFQRRLRSPRRTGRCCSTAKNHL